MIELTKQQRQALAQQAEAPMRAVDPDTNITYVLVREEVYDRAIGRLADDDESLDELYPHVMEVFGQSGWDDPAMDVYDELDPRPQP